MAWRKITADQYRLGTDEEGFDEAFVQDADGWRREVWDVGCDLDDDGNVIIYTASANPLLVRPEHPISVR
jgi:hypothetical protein